MRRRIRRTICVSFFHPGYWPTLPKTRCAGWKLKPDQAPPSSRPPPVLHPSEYVTRGDGGQRWGGQVWFGRCAAVAHQTLLVANPYLLGALNELRDFVASLSRLELFRMATSSINVHRVVVPSRCRGLRPPGYPDRGGRSPFFPPRSGYRGVGARDNAKEGIFLQDFFRRASVLGGGGARVAGVGPLYTIYLTAFLDWSAVENTPKRGGGAGVAGDGGGGPGECGGGARAQRPAVCAREPHCAARQAALLGHVCHDAGPLQGGTGGYAGHGAGAAGRAGT
eukprot:1191130-Prorocentrum_minimum.AAC.1